LVENQGLNVSTVTSNGVHIPFSPAYFGPMRETDVAAGDETLRARYQADGYVLLRKFLPADAVRRVRRAYDAAFETARKNGDLPRHGIKGHPAYDFVRGPVFRAFVDQPVFQQLAERITGATFATIRRTPLRHFLAGSKLASRAHIDGTYIDGAPTDVVTVWTPLGDCTVNDGSLMYLEGSHVGDVPAQVRGGAPMDRASDVRPITHNLKWLADTTARRWLTADFTAGDVVVHSPAIIHATLDCAGRDRLSADVRLSRVGGPRDPRWERDWSSDDGY
jgi:ectoine hydroxylase-related dioxygenase (phytanoyl-CoA dioxygenase family)